MAASRHHGTLPTSASEVARAHRSQFSVGVGSLAVAITGLVGLLLMMFGLSGNQIYAYLASAITPTIPLCLVATTYRSSRSYLFSSGFWLAVTVCFYLVLKAFSMIADGDGNTIVVPMLATCLFLTGYALVAVYFGGPKLAAHQKPRDNAVASGGVLLIVLLILAFEMMAFLLTLSSGAENTVLKVAAATQNSGAAYLYRVPLLANTLYLLILIPAYRSKKYIIAALFCTFVILFCDILSSIRSGMIILVLWNVYLYNRFISPVNILYLLLMAPVFILVVVVFGYARLIGIGDFGVIWKSIDYLWNNNGVIIQLFMNRLDMLPQMAKAFELDQVGRLPRLDGASYVYAFLHAIPRNIWPDKPALTAAVLTRVTYPGPFSDGVLIYPSIVVESVMNLGWSGLFVVGVATGAMATAFDRVMAGRSTLSMVWAMTFFSFPLGLVCEGFHSNYFANLIYMSALVGLLFICLHVAGILRPGTGPKALKA